MSNEYLNNKFFEKAMIRFQECKKRKFEYEDQYVKLKKALDNTVINKKNDPLYEEIISDYKESQKILYICFQTLSENVTRYWLTKNIDRLAMIDTDDAIQECIMICFDKVDRFNPEIGKGFSYMTTCILNHLRQLFRTAKNYSEFKKKFQDHMEYKEKIFNKIRYQPAKAPELNY